MLSVEENKLLTETGPGTLMGNLLRRYWLPVLISDELPEPDCPPVRVKIMSENLVAFRDTQNNIALVDEHCPHRRASLFFGRNEECGLRCVYHGWKFDTSGQCVDMPSEPLESNFKEHVKIKSYPCKEYGGVIWTYMGPPEHMPEMPPYHYGFVKKNHMKISRNHQQGNYFQGIEGALDSSHISFLHKRENPNPTAFQKLKNKFGDPKFEIVKTDYGMMVGAKRTTEDPETVYWRITQFLMPCLIMVPPIALESTDVDTLGLTTWVPMDDENCTYWVIQFDPLYAVDDPKSRIAPRPPMIPGTIRSVANRDNDYQIDRKVQASRASFTGIPYIQSEDQAMTESQGDIADRSQEKLGTSDAAIIVARRVLVNAAKGLKNGEPPLGSAPQNLKLRAASVMLPKGVSFPEGAQEFFEYRVTDAIGYLPIETVLPINQNKDQNKEATPLNNAKVPFSIKEEEQ